MINEDLPETPKTDPFAFLTAPGEMTGRIRELDCAQTPLGPIETWPEELKTSVGIILGAAGPMAVHWGPELILIYNDAARALIGKKHPAALGRPSREVFSEIWEELGPSFCSVMEGEGPVREDGRHLRLNRHDQPEDAWFDYSVGPIFRRDGTIGGLLTVAVEVTDKLRSQQQLQESRLEQARQRRLLEAVLDHAKAYIAVLEGPYLRFSLVNKAYQALRPGIPMLGRTFRSVFPDAAAAGAESLLEEVIETGRPNYQRGFGAPIPGKPEAFWDHQIVRLPVVDSEENSVLLIAWDVTDHKRGQIALQQSEERFREAFEHAPIGMALADLSGRFLHANEAFCSMVGYSREELTSDDFDPRRLIHPDDRERSTELWRNLISGEIPAYSTEKRYIRSDGETIWVQTHSALRRSHLDKPVQVIGLIEDIAPRKNAEEQLRQAQKMEAIGHLAGGVAHEFNNMLTVIIGNADILDARLDTGSPLKQNVKEILVSARRSADMTNQLLGYSRKQMTHPKTIDVNRAVTQQIALLRRLIREDIEVRFEPGEEVWNIEIDPSQLDQILSNLAVNARDAILGWGVVTIKTDNEHLAGAQVDGELPPGDYVRLTFADSGIGMDEETRRKIFDPYFTTKEVGKGTGLGLATVYGIVKQNGGAIFVDSEPGKGTKFTIYLPKSPAVPDSEKPPPKLRAVKGEGTVLVVEDDPQVLELTKTILELAGYRVLTAERPSRALQIVQENRGKIDLLLTDVIMPEFDGRVLRSLIQEVQPDLPTVFMSGYSETEIADHPLAEEKDQFIQKPFTAEALTAKLREVLSKGSLR